MSQADTKGDPTATAAAGIAETEAIAEEGFIYGLPLVMNYAVMHEFAVDTKGSQFKAPFNEIDGNTYNFGYIGSRATGTEAGDYLVVGPGWKASVPAGIKKVFSSTTPFALVLFRTQLFDDADMPNVKKIQESYKGQPLSAFLKLPAPPGAPKIDFLPASTEGIKAHFFEYLAAALKFVPPSPEDRAKPPGIVAAN
jgi:hypothetical protein